MKIMSKVYELIVRMRAKECKGRLHVNRFSVVSSSTILDDNVNFNGMRISGIGTVTIGKNFHSGRDCLIISQNHNYDSGKMIPYDKTYIAKDVVIGDNVWIGDRVIILGGSVIGEGAIIQAGSVVVGKISPLSIAGGHPAKAFRTRNEEHYYRLKEEGKFF